MRTPALMLKMRLKEADTRFGQRIASTKREAFWKLLIFSTCCFSLIWCLVKTLTPAPVGALKGNGTICPRQTICAEDWLSLVLLGISRASAYFSYPLMLLVLLSKTNHLRTALQQSWLSILLPFFDLHNLHTWVGKFITVSYTVHSVAHLTRWVVNDDFSFVWENQTGITGMAAFLLMPLIALPMWLKVLKTKLSWELRKGLHYLSIPWGVAIVFHAPATHLAIVFGIPFLIYVLDYLLGSYARSYLVATSSFKHMEGSVELTFSHPSGFHADGTGYVLVCLPWISATEWHAFSVFPHPTEADCSCVCMNVNGDWTRALHKMVQQPTVRPAWISGPFASPYATAVQYDSLVLVASGIGITPALSVITSLNQSRRTNLVWICRDAALLEFYLHKCRFGEDNSTAWTLIYYTGKRKLQLDVDLAPTVLIFNGRPNLERVICEMVVGTELNIGLPEQMIHQSEENEMCAAHFKRSLSLDDVVTATECFAISLKQMLVTHGEDGLRKRLEALFAAGAVGLMTQGGQSERQMDELKPETRTRATGGLLASREISINDFVDIFALELNTADFSAAKVAELHKALHGKQSGCICVLSLLQLIAKAVREVFPPDPERVRASQLTFPQNANSAANSPVRSAAGSPTNPLVNLPIGSVVQAPVDTLMNPTAGSLANFNSSVNSPVDSPGGSPVTSLAISPAKLDDHFDVNARSGVPDAKCVTPRDWWSGGRAIVEASAPRCSAATLAPAGEAVLAPTGEAMLAPAEQAFALVAMEKAAAEAAEPTVETLQETLEAAAVEKEAATNGDGGNNGQRGSWDSRRNAVRAKACLEMESETQARVEAEAGAEAEQSTEAEAHDIDRVSAELSTLNRIRVNVADATVETLGDAQWVKQVVEHPIDVLSALGIVPSSEATPDLSRRFGSVHQMALKSFGTSPPHRRLSKADGFAISGDLARKSAALASTFFEESQREKMRSASAKGKPAFRGVHGPVVQDLIGTKRLSTWGMLYCGGSQPVARSLREIERKHGLALRVEKFDW